MTRPTELVSESASFPLQVLDPKPALKNSANLRLGSEVTDKQVDDHHDVQRSARVSLLCNNTL